MSEKPQPITDDEADAALAELARFDHVVLAVSGGPDSLALMVLAAEWRSRAPSLRPDLSVATVDHGLRKESLLEAQQVAVEAQRLGLPHDIPTWDSKKPETGLPNAARDARYRLLEMEAQKFGAGKVAIITAHHRDDQAETLAMRLARGAGIDGLSGMQRARPMRDGSAIMLLRPLLSFPKARLVASLDARGIAYAEDPTNRDGRYERARVRSALATFKAAGLSSEALAMSAERLAGAREALEYGEKRFSASLDLSYGNEVFAKFGRSAFEDGPAFLRQKVLAKLIRRFGGASPAPQLGEVEDLVARMQREEVSAATLGGAMISSGQRFVRVWREVGRLDCSEILLREGESKIWDRRFVLRFSGDCDGDPASQATVKPLGEKGYAVVAAHLAPALRPPARAIMALPSFWLGDTFVAAPSLAPFALLGAPPLDRTGCDLNPLATHSGF